MLLVDLVARFSLRNSSAHLLMHASDYSRTDSYQWVLGKPPNKRLTRLMLLSFYCILLENFLLGKLELGLSSNATFRLWF